MEYNIKLAELGKGKIDEDIPSFFMSRSGLYTIEALYFKGKNPYKCEEAIEKLLTRSDICFNKGVDYELLYGNAGYLYCLLLVIKNWGKTKELENLVVDVVVDLINHGL